MDLEDLSKSQLLLLMLLVNFITSIAVSVLTVSLLAQAPTVVTQTVNQIVDHTIETVATGTPLSVITAPPTTITKTVIQTSDSLLPGAINAAASRAVELYGQGGTTSPMIARGTFIPSAHAVVTNTLSTGLPQNVVVAFSDGSTRTASISHEGATLTIYGFADNAVLPKASTGTLVPAANLKQGQTVVALTSDGSAVTGIISKVDADGVHTNLPNVSAGAALVDLSGNILGISTGSASLYVPTDKITTLLNATSASAGS